jgi:flagellar hook protein FlgE
MNGILGTGVLGMRSAMAELQGSAARVARSGLGIQGPGATPVDAVDLAAEAVAQTQARHRFTASANVVKTADAVLGTLLDTLA